MTTNTIEALRVLQSGLEGVKAQGTLTMDTQPTANDTVTIGSITYTWVASGAVSGQINVGADLAAAKVNFVAAINGVDSIQDGANPFVSAAAFVSNNCVLTARNVGTRGNSIATTETFTAVTNVFDAATLGTTRAGSLARGTAVAADQRMNVEQLEWQPDSNTYHPKVENGVIWQYQGPGTPTKYGTLFTLPSQAAIWEQLPRWLAMLLGEPVITSAGLGGATTFTWTLAPSTNPNPLAVTLQRRFSDGTTNVDERAAYAMLSELSLAFAANEELKLDGGSGFARKFETSAITGALSLADFATMVSALSTVYFDDLFADVGTTLVAEQVIGWKWTHNNGAFPRPTAEGRTTLDFTKHQINGGARNATLQVQCLLDPTTYAAELTRSASPDTNQFAVEVKVTGDDGRVLTLDMMMQHSQPLPAIGADQGQDTMTFDLLICPTASDAMVVTLTLPNTNTI